MATKAEPAFRYRELGPLAQGGMAVLCRGERDDGVTVVIKRIRPPYEHDAAYRGLFRDEGAIAARLESEHIVRLLEEGEDDLGPFLVFEYVEGTDLGVVLDRLFEEQRGLDLGAFFAVALPLLSALSDAHTACGDDGACLEVVHRDVSPGNVLLDKDGDVKLADFGVAASVLKTEHTVAGEMKGKFAYMAPEQTRGEKVDARADQFAAGAVLWECLTGRRLFDGPTDADVVHAVREAEVAPPSEHNKDAPASLDAVVLRLLAREPDERYEDADAARAALLDVAREVFCDKGGRRHVSRLVRTYPRPEIEEHPHVSELRRRTQRVMQAPGASSEVTTGSGSFRWVPIAVVALALVGVVVWATSESGERKTLGGPVAVVQDDAPTPKDPPSPSPELTVPPKPVPTVVQAPLPTATTEPPTPAPKAVAQKPPPEAATKPRPKPVPKPAPKPTTVASSTSTSTRSSEKGFGKLSVASEPWAEVAIDGAPLGQQTPILSMQLPAGKHVVTLTNPHFKLKRSFTVEIVRGEETRRFVDLTARK